MASRITAAVATLLLCTCLISSTSSQPAVKKPASFPALKKAAQAVGAAGAKVVKRPAKIAPPPPPVVAKTAEQYYNMNSNWGDVPFNQSAIVRLMKRVMRAIRMPDYQMLFTAFQDILSVRGQGGVTYLLPLDIYRYHSFKVNYASPAYQKIITYQVLQTVMSYQDIKALEPGTKLPTVEGSNVIKMSKPEKNVTTLQGKTYIPTPIVLPNVLAGPSGVVHIIGWPLLPPSV